MSRIALTPNASGTGTLTIAAPNTNTDRTLTLPDATGTVNVSGLANEVPAGSAGAPAIYSTGDTNTGIFFPAADTIAFAEGGAEVARFDSSGNLGIGTTSPSYALSVARNTSSELAIQAVNAGVGNTGIRLQNSLRHWSLFVNDGDSGALRFYDYTAGTERARIDASGNLLVGTTSGSGGNERLNVTGSVNSHIMRMANSNASPYGPDISYSSASPNGTSNEFIQCRDSVVRMTVRSNGGIANYSANNVNLSDERVKTDVAPLGSYWDKIKALQVVTYKYLDQTHDDDNIGVIAQQVESVAPEFVSNDGFGKIPEDGVPLKSIYEADLHYATLKALQEAMARIEELTARVAELEAK